jgi:hypothetical protein
VSSRGIPPALVMIGFGSRRLVVREPVRERRENRISTIDGACFRCSGRGSLRLAAPHDTLKQRGCPPGCGLVGGYCSGVVRPVGASASPSRM